MAPYFLPGGKTNKQVVIRKNKAGWWQQGLQTLCSGAIRECFWVTELQGKPKREVGVLAKKGPGGSPEGERWKRVCRESEPSKQQGEPGGLRGRNHTSQVRSHWQVLNR